jgi:hypothetical protein
MKCQHGQATTPGTCQQNILKSTNGGSAESTEQEEIDMGLDMYAYVAARAGQQDEFYEGAEMDSDTRQYVNPNVNKPREIAYWRKHPNLHGWMAQLWLRREGNELRETDNFNGVELELTYDDLDELEYAVQNNRLPSTSGFFFGEGADDYYKPSDLKFIQEARAEMFLGLKVFYNSSW